MLNLTIEDKIFTFPNGWDEVSLRNYIDIITVGEDKNLSSIDGHIKMLSLLCEDPSFISISQNISIDDFNLIMAAFNWITLDPPAPKTKQKHFLIGKEKWTIKNDFNKLTVGESISVEIMLKDKKLDLSPLEIAFGILFRKLKEDGTAEPLNPDNINLIINEHSKNIKVTDVYSVITFFLSKEKQLSKTSVVSSTLQITKMSSMPQAKKMKTK